DAAERERVGRDLHRACTAASIDHLAQEALYFRRFWRGVRGLSHLGTNAIPDGPQQAAANARGFEDRGHQIRRRRLATRTGDPDNLEPCTRISVELRCQNGERATRVVHDRPGCLHLLRRWFLRNNCDGASFERLSGEDRPICVLTLERDEYMARLNATRVVRDSRHRRLACSRLTRGNRCILRDEIVSAQDG